MRPKGSTPTVDGVGSRKQGNAQAQGESNSCKPGTVNNNTNIDTGTTTLRSNDNNQPPVIPGYTCLSEEEAPSTQKLSSLKIESKEEELRKELFSHAHVIVKTWYIA